MFPELCLGKRSARSSRRGACCAFRECEQSNTQLWHQREQYHTHGAASLASACDSRCSWSLCIHLLLPKEKRKSFYLLSNEKSLKWILVPVPCSTNLWIIQHQWHLCSVMGLLFCMCGYSCCCSEKPGCPWPWAKLVLYCIAKMRKMMCWVYVLRLADLWPGTYCSLTLTM